MRQSTGELCRRDNIKTNNDFRLFLLFLKQ
jgi:hypothetical protein